ncbi:hypothetical protein MDA_GLEAN10010363 [Myotis davidii]|uniref:Uncharacterized protein n=1 Tax=Myotis davidii TaxID=225400 RepID=L5M3U4_MYODS|nr:hypothetical protein MDA_GLEAN10010363 [Myotis davidii]
MEGRAGEGPGGWLTRGCPLLCPALLRMQMIESECFKDINESENEETRDLHQGDKTCQPKPAPKRRRGFFHRLLSSWVRAQALSLRFGAL